MEEIKFKNTSKMFAEEISVFQNYAMKKTNTIMSVGFAAIFIGLGIGLAFLDMTIGIICVVCGVAGGVFFLPYLLKENQKRNIMQVLGNNKYLNTFEFGEDYMHVESTVAANDKNDYQPAGEQTYSYAQILKAVLYSGRLFIFVSAQEAFLLNFQGMTIGTIAELVEFLKTKQIRVIDKSKVIIKEAK